MVNRELLGQWTTALRSGHYAQGQNRLRSTDNTFCCLGVLCDLLAKHNWSSAHDGGWMWKDKTPLDLDRNELADIVEYEDDELPADTRVRLGIDEDDALELITMNDDGVTFGDIADWIEANLADVRDGVSA